MQTRVSRAGGVRDRVGVRDCVGVFHAVLNGTKLRKHKHNFQKIMTKSDPRNITKADVWGMRAVPPFKIGV